MSHCLHADFVIEENRPAGLISPLLQRVPGAFEWLCDRELNFTCQLTASTSLHTASSNAMLEQQAQLHFQFSETLLA